MNFKAKPMIIGQTVLFILIGTIKQCFSAMEGHIIGGQRVMIEKYPHSAFVAMECAQRFGSVEIFVCGASILNQNFLLSAAHCFNSCVLRKSMASASVGSSSRKALTENVISLQVHKKFDPELAGNDIAVVKLEKPLKFSKKVNRVVIMNRPPMVTLAYVAGWGFEDKEELIENYLLNEAKQIVSHKECVDLFSNLPEGVFCAHSASGFPAGGDSGSALVVQRYIQIGMISYKIVNLSNSTTMYTNVTTYLSWIRTEMFIMHCLSHLVPTLQSKKLQLAQVNSLDPALRRNRRNLFVRYV